MPKTNRFLSALCFYSFLFVFPSAEGAFSDAEAFAARLHTRLVGVSPDVEMIPLRVQKLGDEAFIRLQPSSHRRQEADYEWHLENPTASKAVRPLESVSYLWEPPPGWEKRMHEDDEDVGREARFAIDGWDGNIDRGVRGVTADRSITTRAREQRRDREPRRRAHWFAPSGR